MIGIDLEYEVNKNALIKKGVLLNLLKKKKKKKKKKKSFNILII